MFPASNRLGGGNFGFPDPCAVPAVPAPIVTPFPNFGMHTQATKFSQVVKVSMGNALNIGAMITMTSGMEPGSASPIKGPGRFTMGSPIVYIEQLAAVRLLSTTTGNNGNNALGHVLIPATTNVFFAYQSAAPDRLGGDAAAQDGQLVALASALNRAEVCSTMLAERVGRVRISAFGVEVPTAVFNEIRALEARGMSSLVIDLRGNAGGDLDAAIRLAGDFLERGTHIATLTDPDGDEIVFSARQTDPERVPLVVLVDRTTASASEVFAGCMQAHGRAVIVGERTCGKGSVQRFSPSTAEGESCIADAGRMALPNGARIHGVGVAPDVLVDTSLGDSPLDVAIELAANMAITSSTGKSPTSGG